MAAYSKAKVAEWVASKMDVPCHFEDVQVVYDTKDGELVAAVVYERYLDKRDIHMHVAAEGNWLTRRFLEHAFRYPFEKLGCTRVTGLVSDPEKIQFYQLLGFQVEGCLRQALPNGDLTIVGMLKDECRYLNGQTYAKRTATA